MVPLLGFDGIDIAVFSPDTSQEQFVEFDSGYPAVR
jgi:hypothetical protein